MKLSFPEAWASLASDQRTDRAKVLLALQSLDARPGGAWVSATDVASLLKLHLQRNAPKNPSDVLRKAGGDVTLRSDAGRLTWQLTTSGLARFGAWGLAQEPPESTVNTTGQIDIAVLCALTRPELGAVYSAFGGKNAWSDLASPNFPRACRTTRLPVMSGGEVQIVATVSTTMGLTGAAIAASQLISEFRPRLLLTIGIAAGTRATGRDFGDVLVPDPSVDYTSGKIVERAGAKILEPDPYPIVLNPRLKSLLQQYQDSETPFDEIRNSWTGAAPKDPPRLHIGPVGAADQVVDAESVIREIKKNWRKLIGVEMETYGVYRAAHESAVRPLVVAFKAVCDFGAAKTDDFQPYAAHTAAQFARYFVARHWAEIAAISGGQQ